MGTRLRRLLLAGALPLVGGCLSVTPAPTQDTTISWPGDRWQHLQVAFQVAERNVVPFAELEQGTVRFMRLMPFQQIATNVEILLRRKIPQLRVCTSPADCGSYDFLIQLENDAQLSADDSGSSFAAGVVLSVVLRVTDAEGRLVADIRAEGKGYRFREDVGQVDMGAGGTLTGTIVESVLMQRVAKRAADEALVDVLTRLRDGLADSQVLLDRFTAAEMRRVSPCELVVHATFDDQQGGLPNGALDLGETAFAVVEVTNQGPGPGFDVALDTRFDSTFVDVPTRLEVGDIAPGSSTVVRVPIHALDVRGDRVQLRFQAIDSRLYGSPIAGLSLPTRVFVPPALEIVDLSVNDRALPARGDGDGVPTAGERIEIVATLRNAGTGDAMAVEAGAVVAAGDLRPVEAARGLGALPQGGVAEARFLFDVPRNSSNDSAQLRVHATDGRGQSFGFAEETVHLTVRNVQPRLRLTAGILGERGNGSRARNDGELNNGGSSIVALVLANEGQAPARGLSLAFAPERGDLVRFEPAASSIERELGPGETHPLTGTVRIDRRYTEPSVRLMVTVQHDDFPPEVIPLELPVATLAPQIVVVSGEVLPVYRGQRSRTRLAIENRGGLDAENVRIEARSLTPGIDVLAGRVHTRERIAAESVFAGMELDLFVDTSVTQQTGELEITVHEAFFPETTARVRIPILENLGAFEEAPKPTPPPLTVPSAGPPEIAFAGDLASASEAEGEASLQFYIRDALGFADVRLNHNGRQISLQSDAVQMLAARSDGRRVRRYRVPVRIGPGANEFLVTARSHSGEVSTRSLRVTGRAADRKVWVVALGVGRHADSEISALDHASTDARRIGALFADELGLGAVEVRSLLNENATREGIIEAIGGWARRSASPRDVVVIYFAGHGAQEIEAATGAVLENYLVGYDTERRRLNSTGIPFSELRRQVARIDAAAVVLLLDSCFSGQAGGRTLAESTAAAQPSDSSLHLLADNGRATIVLAASGPDEVAREGDSHGLFTEYLVRGLQGEGDQPPYGDADGQVGALELHRYLSRKVSYASGGRQNPQVYSNVEREVGLVDLAR